MKIRRYLGYDCDSVDGFNNGRYIDDDYIEVKGLTEATKLCMESLSEYLGYDVTEENSEDISHGDGNPCIEVITGHYNSKTGEELTDKQVDELDGEEYDKGLVHYRYVYVSIDSE
jgi:hypothetical protein